MEAEQFWSVIHDWLDEHAVTMRSLLNPPATVSDIAALEAATGFKLPDAFRASYLIHNGSQSNSGPIAGLELMSLEVVQSNWEMWADIAADEDEDLDEPCRSVPVDAVQLKYSHRGWLPFCGDSQNFVALDYAPGPMGLNAQVINTGRDDEVRHVIAADITAFFSFVVWQFETGKVTVRPSDSDEPPRWLAINEGADLLTALPELLGINQ